MSLDVLSKKRIQSSLVLITTMLLAACSSDHGESQEAEKTTEVIADQIIIGAEIYTVDDKNPWADAVAIKDGRFIYVGKAESVKAYKGENTLVTNLNGKFILPGMIDSHTHPGYIELEQYGPLIWEAEAEDLLPAIEKYAQENPGDGWIRACCWPTSHYVKNGKGPNKEDLDAIVGDRPVWVTSAAWHSYWLNTKGLEAVGVTADTPDPKPGVAEYVRDENGEHTGWVKEGAGWQFFAEQFDIDDKEAQQKHIESFLQTLSQHGVTTVYDAGNFGYEDHVYGFLANLEKQGRLPVRYEGTYQVFVPEARHRAVEQMKCLRAAYGGERLRFRTIKLFMDGVLENRSGALQADYDDTPNHKGETTLTVEELRDFLIELHAESFDLHIHALGDKAVKHALDAIEAAQEQVGEDFYPRVTLAHLHYVDPAEWPRFAELGVSANFTPWWHGEYDDTDAENTALGQERVASTYMAKPIFDSGGNVTFSSDEWSLEPLSPFYGMEIGHNRQYPSENDGENKPFRLPATERLDLALMIKGYTRNGAFPFRMENEIGTIEVGKLADLVVLDEDLFEVDRYKLHEVKPAAVMMEGEIIQGTL